MPRIALPGVTHAPAGTANDGPTDDKRDSPLEATAAADVSRS